MYRLPVDYRNYLCSQVVPFPADSGTFFTSKYLAALAAVSPTAHPSPASMEGYLSGRVVIALLEQLKCDQPVSEGSLSEAVYARCCAISVDELSVGPFLNNSCGQGLRQVWLANGTGSASSGNSGGYHLLNQATLSFLPAGSCSATVPQLGPKALVFGQSAPFTGPSGPNGPPLEAGILAAFAEQNARGGIYGHMLRLVSLDDGYVVASAVANTKAFISRGMYGLIGYYGTSISTNAASLALQAKVPLITPYTGTTSIRGPGTYVVNVRAAYTDEVYALIRYATATRRLTRISIFYQNDVFGLQGCNALVTALAAINLNVLSNGTYVANTAVVAPGLSDIVNNAQPFTPEAVLLFAAGAPAAAFIRAAQAVLPSTTLYLSPSVVGEGFISNFQTNYSNIVITQAVPLATDTSYKVTVDYQAAMRKQNSSFQPSLVSFESYINARLAINALLGVPSNETLNSTSFLSSVASARDFLVSQLLLGPYTSNCNQGMRQVWYSHIQNGRYASIPNETFTFAESSCMSEVSVFRTSFLVFGLSAPLTGPLGGLGEAIQAGILAAFGEQNALGGVSGYQLQLWSLDDGGNASQAAVNTVSLGQRQPLALIGYYGSEVTNAAVSVASALGVPMIGPISGNASGALLSNPYVVNLRARYSDEMNALLNYATFSLGLTRISLFYSEDGFGKQGVSAASKALDAIGLDLLSSGSCSGSCADVLPGLAGIASNARAVVPQAVVVWSSSADIAVRFIAAAQAQWGSSSPATVYLCPSSVGDGFLAQLSSSAAVGDIRHVYVSQVVPPVTYTSHPLVERYLNAMRSFSSSVQPSMLSFESYVSARLAISVLQISSASTLRDRNAFLHTLYRSSSFVVDTVTAGPFLEGSCNLGLRQVWITRCTASGLLNLPEGTFGFGNSCPSVAKLSLRQPVVFAHLVPKSSEIAALHAVGIEAGFLELNGGSASATFHLVPLSYDASRPTSALVEQLSGYDFTAVISSLTEPGMVAAASSVTSSLDSGKLLSLSLRGPATPAVHRPVNSWNVFLGCTPRDEAFAMMQFIKTSLSMVGVALVYEAVSGSSEVVSAVKLASDQYLTTVASELSYQSPVTDATSTSMVSGCGSAEAVLIHGTNSSDILKILLALKVNRPAQPIFVFLSEIEPMNVVAGLPSGVVGVYFTEFLPSPSSTTDLISVNSRASVQQLNASLGGSGSFSAMEGYLAAELVAQLVGSHQGSAGAGGLKQALYSASVFSVEEVRIGPYVDSSCQSFSKDESCQCDLGAGSVVLLQVSSSGGTVEQAPNGVLSYSTCEVQSTISSSSGSGLWSAGFIAGVIVTALVVICLAGGCVLYLLLSKKRARDASIKAAPKGEVTIAFTDVQDSTRLWDVCPGMHDALEAHNDVMRLLIQRYQVCVGRICFKKRSILRY